MFLGLVHRDVQPKQVFKVPKRLIDLHSGVVNPQRGLGLQIGHDPERVGHALPPDRDEVDLDFALVEQLMVDLLLAQADGQDDLASLGRVELGRLAAQVEPNHKVDPGLDTVLLVNWLYCPNSCPNLREAGGLDHEGRLDHEVTRRRTKGGAADRNPHAARSTKHEEREGRVRQHPSRSCASRASGPWRLRDQGLRPTLFRYPLGAWLSSGWGRYSRPWQISL